MINNEVFQAVKKYFEAYSELDDDSHLFTSRKGNGPILSQRAGDLVKQWCSAIGLKGNFGCHTLRKTFGYMQRTKFRTPWELLSKRYNHSTPAITMGYLGITSDEILNMLNNNIG